MTWRSSRAAVRGRRGECGRLGRSEHVGKSAAQPTPGVVDPVGHLVEVPGGGGDPSGQARLARLAADRQPIGEHPADLVVPVRGSPGPRHRAADARAQFRVPVGVPAKVLGRGAQRRCAQRTDGGHDIPGQRADLPQQPGDRMAGTQATGDQDGVNPSTQVVGDAAEPVQRVTHRVPRRQAGPGDP